MDSCADIVIVYSYLGVSVLHLFVSDGFCEECLAAHIGRYAAGCRSVRRETHGHAKPGPIGITKCRTAARLRPAICMLTEPHVDVDRASTGHHARPRSDPLLAPGCRQLHHAATVLQATRLQDCWHWKGAQCLFTVATVLLCHSSSSGVVLCIRRLTCSRTGSPFVFVFSNSNLEFV